MTKLTKHEKKALAVVLSAGYSAYKDNEQDVSDIFLKKYDTPHGLTLGMSYSRALDKLGLHTFWTEHEKFINEHKLDEVDLIKRELREGKYND